MTYAVQITKPSLDLRNSSLDLVERGRFSYPLSIVWERGSMERTLCILLCQMSVMSMVKGPREEWQGVRQDWADPVCTWQPPWGEKPMGWGVRIPPKSMAPYARDSGWERFLDCKCRLQGCRASYPPRPTWKCNVSAGNFLGRSNFSDFS